MSNKISHYTSKLQMLYSHKVEQLIRAQAGNNKFRCQVLQAEADAICQELKQYGLLK